MFKFVPGLATVHRTPFSPLRSKKVAGYHLCYV